MSEQTRTGAGVEPLLAVADEETANREDPGSGAAAPPGAAGEPVPEAEQQAPAVILPENHERRALLEAIIYVAEEPLSVEQIAGGLAWPPETVRGDLRKLIESYASADRGLEIRAVAGGYKMFTKPEHHDTVRGFVKTLKPKLKLSLPALETLAVIAYKQPITIPEIQAIRGVNVAGVISTLLNRKLITTAGRKKVIGKPMLYRTTKEFLLQFGLADLSELPNLKELEELSRAALGEGELADETEESPGAAVEGSGGSEPPVAPSGEESPKIEEMVNAVDRAVHGGSGSPPEAPQDASEPEKQVPGEHGES